MLAYPRVGASDRQAVGERRRSLVSGWKGRDLRAYTEKLRREKAKGKRRVEGVGHPTS
jgi:hypothetical protein